jgi:hypothetical protein
MGWFEILKVDIEFDKDSTGFGAFIMETDEDVDLREIARKVEQGDTVGIKDFMKEKITINHQAAYEYLKEKFGREPKDQELMQYITRIIMHEGTHAGMGEEQMAFAPHQSEYGAMTGQFPEDTYLRLKNYIEHPATAQAYLPPVLAHFMGLNDSGRHDFDNTRKIKDILVFIDSMVDELPKKDKELAREKLARLEVLARKNKRNKDIRDVDIRDLNALIDRYGVKNRMFLYKLARSVNEERGIEFTDEELKMVGAVTTASSPAMFNKVVRGRKKRRRKQ